MTVIYGDGEIKRRDTSEFQKHQLVYLVDDPGKVIGPVPIVKVLQPSYTAQYVINDPYVVDKRYVVPDNCIYTSLAKAKKHAAYLKALRAFFNYMREEIG